MENNLKIHDATYICSVDTPLRAMWCDHTIGQNSFMSQQRWVWRDKRARADITWCKTDINVLMTQAVEKAGCIALCIDLFIVYSYYHIKYLIPKTTCFLCDAGRFPYFHTTNHSVSMTFICIQEWHSFRRQTNKTMPEIDMRCHQIFSNSLRQVWPGAYDGQTVKAIGLPHNDCNKRSKYY